MRGEAIDFSQLACVERHIDEPVDLLVFENVEDGNDGLARNCGSNRADRFASSFALQILGEWRCVADEVLESLQQESVGSLAAPSGKTTDVLRPPGGNLLNTYLLANMSYLYTSRVTFFPTTYNYLLLHGGYGIELSGDNSFSMDTNVSFGGFTYGRTSENPATSLLDAERFFQDFGSSISIQVGVGHRF